VKVCYGRFVEGGSSGVEAWWCVWDDLERG